MTYPSDGTRAHTLSRWVSRAILLPRLERVQAKRSRHGKRVESRAAAEWKALARDRWSGDDRRIDSPVRLRSGRWRVAWSQSMNSEDAYPIMASRVKDEVLERELIPMAARHSGRTADYWTEVSISADDEDGADVSADIWSLRHGGRELFFDLERGLVARTLRQKVADTYVLHRRNYSMNVPCVDFSMVGDRLILEPFIGHTNLDRISQRTRAKLAKQLTRALVELVEDQATRGPASPVELEQILRTSPIAEARERAREILELFGPDGTVPIVPQHSDLKLSNVRVLAEARAVAIDLDDVRPLPFWADFLCLVENSFSDESTRRLFDEDFHALLEAGGRRAGRLEDVKVLEKLLAVSFDAFVQRIEGGGLVARLRSATADEKALADWNRAIRRFAASGRLNWQRELPWW